MYKLLVPLDATNILKSFKTEYTLVIPKVLKVNVCANCHEVIFEGIVGIKIPNIPLIKLLTGSNTKTSEPFSLI